MNQLHVAGVSHKSTPIDVLEKIHINERGLAAALEAISSRNGIVEAVIISTCNRVELYAVSPADIKDEFTGFFIANKDMGGHKAEVYAYTGLEAVRHLFKVASGLDSALIGEPQILKQVKSAYETARSLGTTSLILNKLFQKAFSVSKEVRHNTSISARSVSLGSISMKIINRIFPSVSDVIISVFGTGEIGADVCRYLSKHNPRQINVITSREEIAERIPAASYVTYSDKQRCIAISNVLVTATYSDKWLITAEDLEGKYKNPLLVLDLSLPRVVSPDVARLEEAYLYNLDDLAKIANKNMAKRKEELDKALSLVDIEATSFVEDITARLKAMHGSSQSQQSPFDTTV